MTAITEPTLEMCSAYMRGVGFAPKDVDRWTAYNRSHLGTPHESGFIHGLRCALAAQAGLPDPPPPGQPKAKRNRLSSHGAEISASPKKCRRRAP